MPRRLTVPVRVPARLIVRLRLTAIAAVAFFVCWEAAAVVEGFGIPEGFISGSTLSVEDQIRYKAAFKAVDRKQWRTALKNISRARDTLPGEVIRWLYLIQPSPTATFDEIRDFIASHPDWPRQESLRRNAEIALARTGDDADVLAWFGKNPPTTGQGKFRLAEAYLASGRNVDALPLIRDAWVNGKFPSREERSVYRRHRKKLTIEDHAARLDRLLWDKQRSGARRMLYRVSSDHKALGFARLALIESAGNVDWAVRQVPDHLQNHPGLVFERVRWRRKKGFDDRAAELLVSVLGALGRPSAWWPERHILARRALAKGHVTQAYQIARDHGQAERAERADAEWLAGWISLRFLNDAETAFDHFYRVYQDVRYPISVARAAYWAARAAGTMGFDATAQAWFREARRHPDTYYGQLATLQLNSPTTLNLNDNLRPTSEEATAFQQRKVVRVVRALVELGQTKHLRPFIIRLARLAATPGEHELVSILAQSAGRLDLAVAAAKESGRAGVLMPRRSFPIIEFRDVADVEKALLLALVRQESQFDPSAISPAGARGLMQLMPSTARVVARQEKLRYSKQRLNQDPHYNTRLGSAYLSDLIEKYDGSYVLALAAYNAGTPRVRNWIRTFGDPRDADVDVIDWIELIPFTETRNYVQRVLEGLQVYRQRLTELKIELQLAKDLNRGSRS